MVHRQYLPMPLNSFETAFHKSRWLHQLATVSPQTPTNVTLNNPEQGCLKPWLRGNNRHGAGAGNMRFIKYLPKGSQLYILYPCRVPTLRHVRSWLKLTNSISDPIGSIPREAMFILETTRSTSHTPRPMSTRRGPICIHKDRERRGCRDRGGWTLMAMLAVGCCCCRG